MALYLASNTGSPVWIARFDANTLSPYPVSRYAQGWKPGDPSNWWIADTWTQPPMPISEYYNKQVFIEFSYYFISGFEYKVHIGNSNTFVFPYFY
jgi:hypothetical protein